MKRSLYTSLSVVLLGALALAQNAVPFVLQPLRPVSAIPGMSGLTLTVNGVGFASGATVNWNGSARATTLVSSTKLTASITATDLAHVGTALITVTNAAPGGGASNVVYFPVRQKTSPGGFARTDTTTNSVTPYGMFVADFNNDGKLDVVVSYQSSPVMAVFLGNGDGTFQAPVTTAQSDSSWPVAIGDFNGDGKLDVVTEGNFGTVWFYFGNGDGTFTEQPTTYGPSPASYSAGDVNGDGKLDLIVGDSVTLIEPAKGLTEAEMKKKQSEWQGELQAAQAALSKTQSDKEIDAKTKAKARAEYQKVYNKRSEFMKQEMTGFVWVYLQK